MRSAYVKAWTGTSFADAFTVPEAQVEYAVFQRERCPGSGRLHWQWLAVFKSRVRLPLVKKLLGEVHAEPARSTKACREYCMKQESRESEPVEVGVWLEEVESVVAALKRVRPHQLLEQRPSLWRSFRAMVDIRSAVMPKRTEVTDCVLLTGLTGSGKSRTVRRICDFLGEEDVFWQDNSQWWDGYQQQAVVVIDEFRGCMPLAQLLRLCDRNPLRVPVKGSSVEFNSACIFLTSNLDLSQMYPGCDARTMDALQRRMSILNFRF